MSDNWVVQNLENALNTWNEKLAEIWQLITQSPENFKGGAILLDPQNEMKGITQRFNGQYFDLSDPDLRLNPLEIPDALLKKNASGREEFILSQLQYMEAFLHRP